VDDGWVPTLVDPKKPKAAARFAVCALERAGAIRAAPDQHWAASDANERTEDFIYHEDAVLVICSERRREYVKPECVSAQ
jgi:hypothetical protein